MSFLREFVCFVVARKKYWLAPVFLIMLLIGGLVVVSKGSVIGPMMYVLF
jgi:uncharacterized protein DUF5989